MITEEEERRIENKEYGREAGWTKRGTHEGYSGGQEAQRKPSTIY
jgi:hypothetical protein